MKASNRYSGRKKRGGPTLDRILREDLSEEGTFTPNQRMSRSPTYQDCNVTLLVSLEKLLCITSPSERQLCILSQRKVQMFLGKELVFPSLVSVSKAFILTQVAERFPDYFPRKNSQIPHSFKI